MAENDVVMTEKEVVMTEKDVVMTEADVGTKAPSETSTNEDGVKKGSRKAYARSLTTSSNVQQAGKSVTVTKGSAAEKKPE